MMFSSSLPSRMPPLSIPAAMVDRGSHHAPLLGFLLPRSFHPSAGDFGTIILGMDLLHLVRLLTTAYRIFLFGSWVAGRSCPMNLSPWVLCSAMSAGGERGCR